MDDSDVDRDSVYDEPTPEQAHLLEMLRAPTQQSSDPAWTSHESLHDQSPQKSETIQKKKMSDSSKGLKGTGKSTQNLSKLEK